jgi:protein phosphatase 1 regulatory subunit 11
LVGKFKNVRLIGGILGRLDCSICWLYKEMDGNSEGQAGNGSVTTTRTVQLDGQLRLRAENNQVQQQQDAEEEENGESSRRQVRWTEDVVDNEHMNKKKSKICCIYRRPKDFGESSSESSDSDSDSDCGHDHHHDDAAPGKPNAYERQPKYKPSAS